MNLRLDKLTGFLHMLADIEDLRRSRKVIKLAEMPKILRDDYLLFLSKKGLPQPEIIELKHLEAWNEKLQDAGFYEETPL